MRRHQRARQKISGTAERPRMSVFISNRHIYVQFIDDVAARTIAAVSTMAEGQRDGRKDVDKAKDLGKKAAEAARAKGIETVILDRGGFSYEGRIQALADAAREAGLKF